MSTASSSAPVLITSHTSVCGIPIHFCCETSRFLMLRVIRADGLMKRGDFDVCNPYCKITVLSCGGTYALGKSIRTRKVKNSHFPCWNEEFVLRVNPDSVISLEVYDKRRIARNRFMGRVTLSLQHQNIVVEQDGLNILPKTYHLRSLRSHSPVNGTLTLLTAYLPSGINPRLSTTVDVSRRAAMFPQTRREQPTSLPITREPVIRACDGNNSGLSNEVETTVAASRGAPTDQLLPVWVEYRDSNGSSYFVNREQRCTQWNNPSSSVTPDGWEKKVDSHGRVYYVNLTDGTTTWRLPVNQGPGSAPILHESSGTRRTDSEPTLSTEQGRYQSPSSSSQQSSPFSNVQCSAMDDVGSKTMCSRRSEENAIPRIDEHASTTTGGANGTTEKNSSNEHVSQPSTQSSVSHSSNIEFELIQLGEDAQPLPEGWDVGRTADGHLLFIDHKTKTTTRRDPRVISSPHQRGTVSELAPSLESILKDLGPLPPGWEARYDTKGRIFYINHNARTTQWEDPRLKKFGGPALPYHRDYPMKCKYIYSRLPPPRDPNATFALRIRRQHVLSDSFNRLKQVNNPEVLRNKLWIEFKGEDGLDYNGLVKEWSYIISRELFTPKYALFVHSSDTNYALQINPASSLAVEGCLKMFYLTGLLIGTLIYHGLSMDAQFSPIFFKNLLGKKITLDDVAVVDTDYHRSLRHIKEDDVSDLNLNMSVQEECFGKLTEIDLVPNGRNIPLTNDNKEEYLNAVVERRYVGAVQEMTSSLKRGIDEVFSFNLLRILDEKEMELLFCGLIDIDAKDWQANTEYKRGYHANHPVIVNFWKFVHLSNNETRCRLLQFVTGTNRVPTSGFSELRGANGLRKFTIECVGDPSELPKAHTCFNRLDLPAYSTYEQMCTKLTIAIENCVGFGGVD